MTYTTVNMEIKPDKLWKDIPLGARIAGSIVAVALIGASLVASVFLAGAALFGGLVMMLYSAIASRGKTATVIDEQDGVVKTEVRQADVAVPSPNEAG